MSFISIILGGIFLSLPVVLITLWIISLCRFISAKNKNKTAPNTFSADEIKSRRIAMIVLSIVVGALVAIVIGIISLLFLALTFM